MSSLRRHTIPIYFFVHPAHAPDAAVVVDLVVRSAVTVDPEPRGEHIDRRRPLDLEAAAGHLAARPPLVTAAPVEVARVRADHLDSDQSPISGRNSAGINCSTTVERPSNGVNVSMMIPFVVMVRIRHSP